MIRANPSPVATLALALLAGCATVSSPPGPPPAARAAWIGPPPETVAPLEWTAVERAGPTYRAEGQLLNGRVHSVTAEASADVPARLWSPAAQPASPASVPTGTGFAPRGLPPEFAFWLGLSDLFQQRAAHAAETREHAEEDDDAHALRLDARSVSTFEPAAGLRCSTSVTRRSTDSRMEYSPVEAVERLYQLPPSDAVREQLGLVGETGWLSWSMAPAEAGGYALQLHVSGDAEATATKESSSWSLVCSSSQPIFASELAGYVAAARETPEGWSATVAQASPAAGCAAPPCRVVSPGLQPPTEKKP